jgi:hypothetical protein
MYKMKKGGSFDLNKDGKTTFKDVLIGRGVLPKTAKKGTKVKKAQNGKSVSMKRGRDTMNITDTSGYAAGKKAGYPAQMISPKTKYSKSDTTNTTVNRKMVSKAIGKQKTGGMTKKCKYGCK